MRKTLFVMLAVIVAVAAACTTTRKATNFNGLKTLEGKTATHINLTNYALNLLLFRPLLGDASLQKTVSDFTLEAKVEGASEVRIVQSRSSMLWYMMIPISLVVTPVITNVAGDAMK